MLPRWATCQLIQRSSKFIFRSHRVQDELPHRRFRMKLGLVATGVHFRAGTSFTSVIRYTDLLLCIFINNVSYKALKLVICGILWLIIEMWFDIFFAGAIFDCTNKTASYSNVLKECSLELCKRRLEEYYGVFFQLLLKW